jgi:hypothetical protein
MSGTRPESLFGTNKSYDHGARTLEVYTTDVAPGHGHVHIKKILQARQTHCVSTSLIQNSFYAFTLS